jgi:hypothetical protein
LKGLIVRLPRSNTYVLTNDGQRFAIFYTKVHNRLLRPMLARISRPRRCRSGKPSEPSAKPSTTTSTKPA